MPRLPDTRSEGRSIQFKARNDEEGFLIRAFKRVLWKDGTEYMDFFKPYIEAKVQSDNPQLHFKSVGDQMVLSKNLPSVKVMPPNPRAVQIICPQCRGGGCPRCANDGWVTEESAP